MHAEVETERRVHIIGESTGQTNVYFFDASGRQIDGLNIAVLTNSQPPALENYPFPANVVLVYDAGLPHTVSCTPIRCIADLHPPGADQPPGTQTIELRGNGAGSPSIFVGK